MKVVNFQIRTGDKTEFINISTQVQNIVSENNIKEGLCIVYIPHTTAAVTINEAADPDVMKDIKKEINKIVPFDDFYKHLEGNSAAHIKTSLFGASELIPVSNGRLTLGTWQGIYFCEFDGPRNRTVNVKILSDM